MTVIAVFSSMAVHAQNGIKGTVTDESGEAVVGATVMVQGSSKGTMTDLYGNYTIQATSKDVLEFSCIGYKTVSEAVGSKATINVVLPDDVEFLDEAIAIGYGSTSRKSLTTAIASVKPEAIEKSAISNVSGLLLGRAAGVQGIVNNAQPDGKINISIRGGSNPVYVVDGIVMPSSSLENGAISSAKLPSSIDRSGLAGINPEDIESIEILKDASAAIYGIGASDGVILITTKKGKSGRPVISYSGSGSFIQNQGMVTPLNAAEYMNAFNAISKEQYLYVNSMAPYGSASYDGNWNPMFTESQMAANTIDHDWTEEVLRNGYIDNQNVTIQGGSDKIKYYLGLNYFDQQGTVYNSGMKRYVVRSNVNAELFPFFRLNTTINYNSNTYQNSTVGGEVDNSQTAGAYYAAAIYPPIMEARDENGDYSLVGVTPNPVALLSIQDNTQKNMIYTNFNAELDIIKDMLKLTGTYGVNKEFVSRQYYIPTSVLFNNVTMSRGQVSDANQAYQTFEATLNFSHTFADWLRVDAVAGMGKYLTDYFSSYAYYQDGNDTIGNDNISLATGTKNISSTRTASEKRSQFARASFDAFGRYFLTATIRRDGTDKFFPSKKYAWFPSVSAAWNVTGEKFMENANWINLLKVRASYGTTGRDNLGSSLYGIYVTKGKNISYNDGVVLYTPYILSGNDYDNVTWEKTVMKNIGVDFSILNDRVWGSFDWYRNDETNQLSYSNSSWMDMFSSYPVNSGHYKRQGWEISFNSRNIANKDFSWETSLTVSRNKTVWVERVDNYDYKAYQLDADGNPKKDEPVSYAYYYEMDGIVNSTASNIPESQKSLDETWQKPGVAIIKDQNGDGVIDVNDICRANVGDPKLYLGFGNTFTWKNWDLDIYAYGRFGFMRYNYGLAYGAPFYMPTNSRNIGSAVNAFFNSETNPEGTMPGIAYNYASVLPESVGVNWGYQDASFLRIRNITLGYTIPASKLSFLKGYVNSIRIYADVQNPFIFTNFDYVDPEITLGNSHASVGYPQTRTWTGGIKIQF